MVEDGKIALIGIMGTALYANELMSLTKGLVLARSLGKNEEVVISLTSSIGQEYL